MPRLNRGARSDIHRRLGALLRQRRRALGWSQVQLAGHVGVQGETISRIERGLHIPPLKKLIDMCRTLRVPLSRLIAELEGGERGGERDQGHGFREALGHLDATDREFVLEMATHHARHLRARRTH